MLTGLRHRAVSGRAHQNRAVHLRRTGDHVLHIVGVPRAVDVSVVTVRAFVFNVRGRDRDTTSLLFRCRVDCVIGLEFATEALGADLGQRSGQSGLAVVNVTDGADVYVRLGALELTLCHFYLPFNLCDSVCLSELSPSW